MEITFVVQHGPKKLISGDKVLLPNLCPLSSLWYRKSGTGELPLKVFAVTKVFHKSGVKYIQTSDDLEVLFEYVYGVILKIIKKEDALYTELHLNKSDN